MVDFRVVPAALRRNVTELDQVADAWQGAQFKLTGVWMADDDLGTVGSSGPARHNAAISEIVTRLGAGFTALNNAAEALKAVADMYAAKDDEYYRTFGYHDESLRRPR
jgi:hypothetical protein